MMVAGFRELFCAPLDCKEASNWLIAELEMELLAEELLLLEELEASEE